MTKKFLARIVPLMLVAFAFAIAPTVATAAGPHWFSEGKRAPQGVSVPTVTWGTLTLKGAAEITCHNDIGGTAENPVGGGAGKDEIFDFSAWLCTSNFTCPAGTFAGVEPTNLPWLTELIEGKSGTKFVIRDNVTGVRVVIGCVIPPEDHVTGTAFVIGTGQKQDPLAPAGEKKGKSASHPGFYEYDAGSGGLEAEGSGGTVTGVTEGETKTLGYEEQEHIYAECSTLEAAPAGCKPVSVTEVVTKAPPATGVGVGTKKCTFGPWPGLAEAAKNICEIEITNTGRAATILTNAITVENPPKKFEFTANNCAAGVLPGGGKCKVAIKQIENAAGKTEKHLFQLENEEETAGTSTELSE